MLPLRATALRRPGASFLPLVVLLLGLLFFGGSTIIEHGDWTTMLFLGGLTAAIGAYLYLAARISEAP